MAPVSLVVVRAAMAPKPFQGDQSDNRSLHVALHIDYLRMD